MIDKVYLRELEANADKIVYEVHKAVDEGTTRQAKKNH
jgi:hypothetical protein